MPSTFRQRFNIKYFMVGYLGLLLLGSAVIAGAPGRFLSGLALIALYAFFDLLWTRLRDHVWYLPVSSWISGLVLANVGPPVLPWWLLILLPLVAVAAKQLLHLRKMRHVFNPAGFSLFIITFITPVVSWWAASINVWTLIVVGMAGLFILWRQQRFHVALSFLFAYALGGTAFSLIRGTDLQAIPSVLQAFLLNGPVIFFTTVMLIEPITSSFPTRRDRIIYGASVGIFSIFSLLIVARIPINDLDPLIIGLLLGNLVASLLFLPKSPSVTNT